MRSYRPLRALPTALSILAAGCALSALAPRLRAEDSAERKIPDSEVLEVEGGTEVVHPTAERATPYASDRFRPGARTVISRERFRTGQRSVADVLEDVPGVTLERAGGALSTTRITIRGSHPGQVLVLLDGVPLNSGAPGASGSHRPGGEGVDLAGLSLDRVERIEVLRGPATSVYGPGAAAGAVLIHTRQAPGRQLGASLTAGTGHYGESSLRMQEPAAQGTLALFANHRRSAGDYVYYDPSAASAPACAQPLGNGYYRLGCHRVFSDALALEWRAPPAQSTRLEWDRLNRLGLGGILDPRPQGRERKETLRLVHEDALSLGVQPGEFQLGWRLMGKEERLRRTDNLSLGALAEGYATLRHLDSGAWWEGHSAGHTLRLGAVLGRQNLEDKRFQARRTEAGLYAQWNHQQGAGVTEASVRGDTLNGGTTRTTGRLALSRMAWGGVGIKTSAATGYRPPSLYELYDPGSPGSGVSAANPGLLPERTRALDAGVFYEDEYRGYVEALRFRQEVREDILAVADPARPSLYRLDNVSRTQAMGWELTLSLRLPWGVEADGGWTRLEATILDNARLDPRDAGHRVPGTAPLRWNAGLSWREGRWRTQYRIRYNGPRFVDTANTRYLKPYRLHEAGVSATLGGGWEVALNGRNLTNETFAEMENQPPPGRELLLTLRWGFGGDRLPASPPPMRAPRSGSATDALPSP